MFNGNSGNRHPVRTESLRTTSLAALRLSCLEACGGDIQRARELCDYIADGLDLPANDPPRPGTLERFRSGADDVIEWLGSHRGEIEQGVSLVQGLVRAAKAGAAAPK